MAAVREIIMDITLVTTSFNDEVHGSENDRKTGCGINLLRPENVTRYRRSGTMTDLKDITCEKCKAVLAKRIIKSDKKEMDRLIKEEKLRAKKGIVDDGIVPLGNTTAKITRDPAEEAKKAVAEREAAEARAAAAAAKKAAEEEARRAAEEEEARKAAEEAEAIRLANRPTITGTNVPMDDSLAQFAINVPKEEKEPQNAVQDDFLAQFAIQKPQDEEASEAQAPAQPDDFLAQFAVNNGVQQNVQPAAPAAPVQSEEPIVDIANEDDIMKMFSIGGQPSNINGFGGAPAEEHEIIDVESSHLSPAAAPEEPEPEVDLSTVSEWDMVANQIFGYENAPQPAAQPVPEEMDELPIGGAPVNEFAGDPASAEIEDIAAPAFDDISVPEPAAPQFDDIAMPEPAAPQFDDIAMPEPGAPQFDDIAMPEPGVPQFDDIAMPEPGVPQFDDIAMPEPAAPQFDDISMPGPGVSQFDDIEVPQLNAPQFDNIAAPDMNEDNNEFEEIGEDNMNKYRYSTPVFADEIRNSQPTPPPVQPQPDQPQVISVPQFAGYDMNGQPIYTYVQMQLTGFDSNGQPIFMPIQGQPGVTAPMAPPPVQRPAQPQAAPVQPKAPVQQAAAPVQPKAPVQQAAAPVQLKAPVQQAAAPVQPKAPVQQAAAPVQPKAPVQQPAAAPVQPSVPRKKPPVQTGPYTTPTANISKIAVNPHSKSTSQSFINAIANSKNYADKNLIETQGLKANAPLLNSIEDALSQMGDDSLKRQKSAAATQNVPVFDEYKGGSKPAARSSAPRKQTEEQDIRFMTKAELKAKKKQDKIDAKFKKDIAKRGL